MHPTVIEISGIIPAIIFPTATLIQLFSIRKRGSAKGVSALTWFLFGIANLGVYIFTEKYSSLQTIIGFLGTATLDFIIVALVIRDRTWTDD